MNNNFNHKLAFLNSEGKCSPQLMGIMRQDESAVIILPQHEKALIEACKVRYYKTATNQYDYIIKNYYQDFERPLGKRLIKPIVIQLEKK